MSAATTTNDTKDASCVRTHENLWVLRSTKGIDAVHDYVRKMSGMSSVWLRPQVGDGGPATWYEALITPRVANNIRTAIDKAQKVAAKGPSKSGALVVTEVAPLELTSESDFPNKEEQMTDTLFVKIPDDLSVKDVQKRLLAILKGWSGLLIEPRHYDKGINVPCDKPGSARHIGFAYITFATREAAQRSAQDGKAPKLAWRLPESVVPFVRYMLDGEAWPTPKDPEARQEYIRCDFCYLERDDCHIDS
jgi:hypothetical protein